MHKRDRPISFGSFSLGVVVLVAGLTASFVFLEDGLRGLAAWWPTLASFLVTAILNFLAFCSPGGSIFSLIRRSRSN